MREVASAQSELLEGFDASSQQRQQLNMQITSEMVTAARAQEQSQLKLDVIHYAVASIDANVQKDLSERIKDVAAKKLAKYDKLSKDCLRALFVTDSEIDKKEIENQKGQVIHNSCDWVLKEFQRLLCREPSCLVWLHGNPGKGKTMIALALVDFLIAEMVPDTLLAYYFCDNTSDKRNSLLQVLKSLLRQALLHAQHHNDTTADSLLDSFDKKGDLMFSSIEALWIELQKLLRSDRLKEACFIVDGLDECDQTSLETFLSLIGAEGLLGASDSSNDLVCRVKWVFVSRNERIIREQLMAIWPVYVIALDANARHVSRAVDEFIDLKVEQLSKLKRYKPELKDFVARTLKSKADDTFLWVSLACRELLKPKVSSINTKLVLGKLPAGLSEIYGRIYDQVMENEYPEMVQFAVRILQSVVLAKRPLVLEELAITAGLPEEARDDNEQLAEYVEQCGSFLVLKTYSPQLRQIHFVHQSAKEYLLQLRPDGIFSSDRTIENGEIAVRCLDYLDNIDLSVADIHPADLLKCKYSAGLQYPLRYWLDHGNLASNRMLHEYKLRGKIFTRESMSWRRWAHRFAFTSDQLIVLRDEGFIQFDYELAHFAAFHGAKWILQPLFERGELASLRITRGRTVLEWATLGGQLETVLWLFDHGWNPRSNPSAGEAALIVAATTDSYAIAELLLNHGVNSNALSRDHRISALTAAARKNPRLVDLLLKFKADIEFRFPNGDTPLSRSVYQNEHAASVSLLQNGAYPNAPVHTSTFLLTSLSSKTGGPDTRSREGSPPLFWALTNGNGRLVSELMAHGADPNTPNEKGDTALHLAAREGCLDEIHSLLSLGALINCINDDGHTPIHYATFGGWPEAAKALLAHGARESDFANARDIFNEGNLPQVAGESRTWKWEGQELICRGSGRRMDFAIDIGQFTDLPQTGSFFDSAVSDFDLSRVT